MTTIRLAALRLRSTFSRAESLTPFARATYVLSAMCIVCTALLTPVEPTLVVFAVALLCGWSEVDGLCGSSHVGTLSPLRRLSPGSTLWLKSVSAYTAGGLASAACVGLALGAVGQLIPYDRPYLSMAAPLFIAALAILLAARELKLVRFRLPQFHLQTHRQWAIEYGMVAAAAMWGSHIGLGFATVVQHGGFFVVVLLALMQGPVWGTSLFAAYWLGRTLPLWFARTLPVNQCAAPELSHALLHNGAAYRHAAATGLICAAIVTLSMAL